MPPMLYGPKALNPRRREIPVPKKGIHVRFDEEEDEEEEEKRKNEKEKENNDDDDDDDDEDEIPGYQLTLEKQLLESSRLRANRLKTRKTKRIWKNSTLKTSTR